MEEEQGKAKRLGRICFYFMHVCQASLTRDPFVYMYFSEMVFCKMCLRKICIMVFMPVIGLMCGLSLLMCSGLTSPT